MSKATITFVATQGNKKVLEGSAPKNFKTNKPVLELARKALSDKLAKSSLCRVAIYRNDKKAGEWTCRTKKTA